MLPLLKQWLRNLVNELGVKVDKLELFSDSQAAIQLAHNPVFHCRTKHISVKYHKVRELIESKDLELKKIGTDPADILTKALSKEKHSVALELLKMT